MNRVKSGSYIYFHTIALLKSKSLLLKVEKDIKRDRNRTANNPC